MSMEDVYSKPGHLFRRMQQIAVAIFMEECAEFDLTPVQYAALVAIREHPDIDATRLAAVIAFDRSTIGDVLERLESKELIARRSTPNDKRVKLLGLTPRGRKLLAAILPSVDRAQERMLAPLGQADRRKLMQLVAQLVDLNNASSRAPRRTPDGTGTQSAGRSTT
jgi:DNA-binding MarR family transcriptional regulator